MHSPTALLSAPADTRFTDSMLSRVVLGLIAMAMFLVPLSPIEGTQGVVRVGFAAVAFFAAVAIIVRDSPTD